MAGSFCHGDRKVVGFGFTHMEMICQAVFVAGQADRDPVIASAEGQLALGQGSLVASGQFCEGLKRTFGSRRAHSPKFVT
jgi:hypothetical protein